LTNTASKLLWFDSAAGATVGLIFVVFHGWLAALYGLPDNFVLFVGLANLAYASFSFSLAIRPSRPRAMFIALVTANIVWGVLCISWAVGYWHTATIFGIGHLALEALFVGGLGITEWLSRQHLNIRC
jgi:hypothetical protein